MNTIELLAPVLPEPVEGFSRLRQAQPERKLIAASIACLFSDFRVIFASFAFKNCLFVFAIYSIAAPAYSTGENEHFDTIKQQFLSSERLLLARDGQVLHRLRVNSSLRRGQWIALDDMSPALKTAMVLSEDKRFYEHSGVDWRAVPAAAWSNLFNRRTRGASTLTMQLATLLNEGAKSDANRKNIFNKASQAISATWLETKLTKAQILEAYLNLVPFRGEIQGIDALSRSLFGKAAHGLNEPEAAIAAALVRAPNAKASVVGQRACGVLQAMLSDQQSISVRAEPVEALRTLRQAQGERSNNANVYAKPNCDALQALSEAALPRKSWQPSEGIAPHLAQKLLAKSEGSIKTSLDASLQRLSLQYLEQQIKELRAQNVQDAAVVILHNTTGQVLAYVGSTGALSDASEVDAAAALRQAGSTLKPFLYAQAIDERRLTAASLIEDSSAQIPTASGLYIPQNYDRSFKGWVSVRTALGASLNVPAVRALVMVGPESFGKQLKNLGLPLKETGDYYGYSLALGSADVSLLSLTNAYRALANNGQYSDVSYKISSDALKFKPTLSPQASFIVSNILSDAQARVSTFGMDSVLNTRRFAAVKTGTSKDMRDNWALGYTAHHTVGVWVGNADGSSMWDVSGVSGAAPVWARLVQALHEREARAGLSAKLKMPTDLVQQNVRLQSAQNAALEPERSEIFIAGTEQNEFQKTPKIIAASAYPTGEKPLNNTQNPAWKIVFPISGSLLALDPDIPPKNQRLLIKSAGAAGVWRINGLALNKTLLSQIQWSPMPGQQRLELLDSEGKLMDALQFEVRGASLKTAVNLRK